MGTTLVGGILAIVGGIVGGLIALVGNHRLEKLRWEREERTRYHQERLQLCTEFYSTAGAIVTAWFADVNEELPSFYVSSEKDLVPKLLQNLIPRFEVMAPPAVRDAARNFDYEIYEAATGGYDADEHPRALQRHLNDFARAAREDLGVPIGTTQDED